MSNFPEIDYTHVLSELSVNRKDPCEVIRELISNSYDAGASTIEIYPTLQYSGFIFFDNGTGLSEIKEVNGITPYKAFFSIGKSTKTIGTSIGYKCQGSKLCFASQKFTLITRCKDEENWRYISIDNPKLNLNPTFSIQSKIDAQPWEFLKNLFLWPDERTVRILDSLNKDYFLNKFSHGAMIIVQGIEIEDFSYYYSTEENGSNGSGKYSYLRNYIRFTTKHGDIRVLRPDDKGFSQAATENFKKTPGYNDQCKLYIWSKELLSEIHVGYPYLSIPDDSSKAQIKNPFNISRLRDGQFYTRRAMNFQFEDRSYCLVLAIDGNRRALNNYDELDRRGQKRSGIRLTDQRGTFICSQGMKICPYNQIFEHSKLVDYVLLGKDDGQSHYVLMINGSFELVTNRNDLSESALKILKNELFIEKIKTFFDKAMKEDEVCRQLVERLRKESESYRIDAYIQQLNSLKSSIQNRTRFMVEGVEPIKGRWFVEPRIGEEHWVGALYTLFSYLVPTNSQYINFWMCPRTFSGTGIDSIAVAIGENKLDASVHKSVEYKYTFSTSEEFNHPLIINDHIICWEMEMPNCGHPEQIIDSYGYFGDTLVTNELLEIGYEITNIQNHDGDSHLANVKVISLKKLIEKTFSCKWTTPPSNTGSETKKTKRR